MDLITLAVAALALFFAWRASQKSIPAPDLTSILTRLDGVDRTWREEAARNRQETSQHLNAIRSEVGQQINAIRESAVDAARLDRDELRRALATLQQTNEAKLEQMRQTVDEKLQGTLEKRLGDSFKLVSDRLEQVHRGLGEMQTLASGVGDLKKVLTNVKVRGTWGEVQLGNLLDQMLAPDQFARNVAIGGRNERVEFALRMPDEEAVVWLPIDAKFPLEDYERLINASEAGDNVAVELAATQLERRLRQSAKDISSKYVQPPHTTEFAILFVPNEGLYSEVLRRPGLCDVLLREHKIHIAGPTTLCALLTSLRYSFQRSAMHRKSAEVWKVLGAAKTEFVKYAEVLAQVKKKLDEASNTVDKAQVRTRAIERSLRAVDNGLDTPAKQTEEHPQLFLERVI